jgi:hypothetical protein
MKPPKNVVVIRQSVPDLAAQAKALLLILGNPLLDEPGEVRGDGSAEELCRPKLPRGGRMNRRRVSGTIKMKDTS